MNIANKQTLPFATPDWLVVLLYVLLVLAGWLSICGASYEYGHAFSEFFSFDTRAGKQLVWILCAMILAFVLLSLDDKIYDGLSWVFYGGMMLLLLVTPFLATDIKGSHSWIKFGSISLQPAEFAKCATALALSKLMGSFGFSMQRRNNAFLAVALVLLPMVLIILQRETGSALVYLSFFLMFYREGMPGSILFTGVAAVVFFVVGTRFSQVSMPHTLTDVGEFVVLLLIYLCSIGMLMVYTPRYGRIVTHLLYGLGVIAVAYLVSYFFPFDLGWVLLAVCAASALYIGVQTFSTRLYNYLFISAFALGSMAFYYSSDYVLNNILEPHQQIRVKVLLGLEKDPKGAGYNVIQSMIAIGSGGIEGKGFLNGTQSKLKYVPEQDTDFIFCTVGEEQGFIGSSVVLLLFMLLILRLIYVAERQVSGFARVYGYCVVSILFFHVFINIGMVLGVTPVIGIPLPFFSYGGSSLWGFTILLFIFLRMDAESRRKQRYAQF